MNPNQLPTKDALKRRYNISNDDFDVLSRNSTPTAEELKQDGHIIEQAADWLGVPVYIIRRGAALATVVAVLLIPAQVKTLQDDVKVACDFYTGLLKPFQKLPNADHQLPDSCFSFTNVATTSSSVMYSTTTLPPGSV